MMKIRFVNVLIVSLFCIDVRSFVIFNQKASKKSFCNKRRRTFLLSQKEDGSDKNDDDEVDWRYYRAMLMRKEELQNQERERRKKLGSAANPFGEETAYFVDMDLNSSNFLNAAENQNQQQEEEEEKNNQTQTSIAALDETKFTPLDPSQWAYESGKAIEKGAVLLGGVEQEIGFGLHQQYFHKTSILILDHEEDFTKGIILNRPTDFVLDDELYPGQKWRVWFGGDVQGLNSRSPEIVCLHSLKDPVAKEKSTLVIKDIMYTSFENAKQLVQQGIASPSDFWVFCGYAGWGQDQLMGEVERKSWYLVVTDSQTLLKELARQTAAADPREAGLDTWKLLMNMIGRREMAEEQTGGFDDLMLKEWTLKNLISKAAGGGEGIMSNPDSAPGFPSFQSLLYYKPTSQEKDNDDKDSVNSIKCVPGDLLGASNDASQSPFLLNHQVLHKSVVLVVKDDDKISAGSMLNRPSGKSIQIDIRDPAKGEVEQLSIPIRYGGEFAVRGADPLLWLHCSNVLKQMGIGRPIGVDDDDEKEGNNKNKDYNVKDGSLWKCTADEATLAISKGFARPMDFMVVSGYTIWTKMEGGLGRNGLHGEIDAGKFKVISSDATPGVFSTLLDQVALDESNFHENFDLSNAAWSKGCETKKENEENVYNSDVKRSDLSDAALRLWLATHLLDAPSLGAMELPPSQLDFQ